jgi:hypothetical protein
MDGHYNVIQDRTKFFDGRESFTSQLARLRLRRTQHEYRGNRCDEPLHVSREHFVVRWLRLHPSSRGQRPAPAPRVLTAPDKQHRADADRRMSRSARFQWHELLLIEVVRVPMLTVGHRNSPAVIETGN